MGRKDYRKTKYHHGKNVDFIRSFSRLNHLGIEPILVGKTIT
jgi:hypothetical protein